MALHRCAACGSPNVVVQTEKEGYNYVKGAIGTVVLGAGGAVAGINGKKKQVFKCPDCGLTLNEPMALEIKTAIDIGVASPQSRKTLKLAGAVVGWEVFVNKYRNIEKDIAVSASSSSVQQSVSEPEAPMATRQLNDLSREELNDIKSQFKDADDKYDILYLAYKGEKEYIDEQRSQKCEVEMGKLRSSLEKSAKETFEREMQSLAVVKVDCARRRDEAEKMLNSLGFFQFGEKSRAKNEVATMTTKLEEAERASASVQQKYNAEMESIKKKLAERQEQLTVELRAEYRYPSTPNRPSYQKILHKNGIAFSEDSNIKIKSAISRIEERMEILEYLKAHSPATISDIKQGCESIKDYTNPRVSALVLQLMEQGKVVRTEDARNAYFSLK